MTNNADASAHARENAGREARVKAIFAQAEPLNVALRRVGHDVESPWDLFNRTRPWDRSELVQAYPDALPILAEHLAYPYHPLTREGIARALSLKQAAPFLPSIVQVFNDTRDSGPIAIREAIALVSSSCAGLWSPERIAEVETSVWASFRHALAGAISVMFGKKELELMLSLIADRKHGEARLILVQTVGRKARRWKDRVSVVETLRPVSAETGYVGQRALEALQKLTA